MPKVRSRYRKWEHVYPWSGVSRWGEFASGSTVLTEQQWTDDELHAWPRLRGSGRDVGGPFSSCRTKVVYDFVPTHFDLTGRYGATWSGTVLPRFNKSATETLNGLNSKDLVLFWSSSESERLNDTQRQFYGTTAINRTLPTNPIVDSSVSIAELFREGLPSLIGSAMLRDKIGFFRSIGSEYLNIEFGWKPLVADLQSAAQAVVQSEKFLLQLQRDSGKNVRRRFVFPAALKTSIGDRVTAGTTTPEPNTAYFWRSGRVSDTITSQTKIWFSGCYTFHYDPGDLSEISRIATQARLLYGAKLTPDVIWELAPWSWLVDWMFNVGPVLSNLSAFSQDGLVLRYGYLQDHSKVSFKVSHRDAVTWTGQAPYGGSFGGAAVVETKTRTRATPYGFGAAIDGFTVRQWSILGALGLTRLPGSL